MDQVKVQVMGREVIKPDTPSPQDEVQLSIFDLSSPAMYVSTVFFYKAEDLDTVSLSEIISRKLKLSLSKTLSRFYPLAGRMEGVSISCNDQGVIFEEARTDLLLPDFLRNLNTNSLTVFLPTIAPRDSPSEWPLLSVKVTFFGSGSGVAVSVSVSHRICDAASILTFVKDWATTTKEESDDHIEVSTLQFAETTVYPPASPLHVSSKSTSMDSIINSTRRCVGNRFVFQSAKIAELKRKAANQSVLVPTRVEAITSLLWRCARNASRSNLVAPRSTVMLQAMDLRLRLPSTVLQRDAIGNLQTLFLLKKGAETELEIRETVAAFRKAKERVNEMIKENLQRKTLGQSLLSEMGSFLSEFKPNVDIYPMSSWCGKPFYEADFGWGSPVWLAAASHAIYDNMMGILLIDSKDGEGVEAWITLPEQDMSVFVHDQELLAYAVLNPPILI